MVASAPLARPGQSPRRNAVVGRTASLAETANRWTTSSVDDWRSAPSFLLSLAPAAHGRCAGAVKCA